MYNCLKFYQFRQILLNFIQVAPSLRWKRRHHQQQSYTTTASEQQRGSSWGSNVKNKWLPKEKKKESLIFFALGCRDCQKYSVNGVGRILLNLQVFIKENRIKNLFATLPSIHPTRLDLYCANWCWRQTRRYFYWAFSGLIKLNIEGDLRRVIFINFSPSHSPICSLPYTSNFYSIWGSLLAFMAVLSSFYAFILAFLGTSREGKINQTFFG